MNKISRIWFIIMFEHKQHQSWKRTIGVIKFELGIKDYSWKKYIKPFREDRDYL